MNKRTVEFKKPGAKPNPTQADEFVSKGEATTEPTKRFTIDVPESLHRRIKMQCAMRGVKMSDVIRDLLEKEFQRANEFRGAIP